MAHMIPDLTHYTRGLDPATFPLVVSETDEQDLSQQVQFTVITLEQLKAELVLDGRGFKVKTLHRPLSDNPTSTKEEQQSFNSRQQEALLGMVYETIEALLMALSPAFEVFFAQELSRRLSFVSWDRLQTDSNSGNSDKNTDSESDMESIEDLDEK
jgi:hypothetical protein